MLPKNGITLDWGEATPKNSKFDGSKTLQIPSYFFRILLIYTVYFKC